MIEWDIIQKNRNKFEDDTPSTNTVQSDNLSAIEKFVREMIANSRDSVLDTNKPVKVSFSFHDYQGDEKQKFVNHFKLDQLKPTYQELEKDSTKISRIFLGEKPSKILYGNKPLRVLVIKDSNTKGLLGPEFPSPRYRDEKDLRFIGLCRYIGKNSTAEGQDSTGSWGYGKSVIWSNNITRIALFNSKLSTPFVNGQQSINNRFIGHAMLPDYMTDDEKAYSGKIYFGNVIKEDGDDGFVIRDVKSACNDEAKNFIAAANLDDLKCTESGTSILIPGFEPGDGQDYDTEKIIGEFKEAIVRYFWPAIVSNELKVELKLNGESQEMKVQRHPDYRDFIKIYKKVLDNPGNEDKNFKLLKIKFPNETTAKGGIALYSGEVGNIHMVNRIAKIRGRNMVIEYADPKISNTSGTSSVGVAMAGSLINGLDGVNSDYQMKLDNLLKNSEPISHHKWDDKNPKLKPLKASSAIYRINQMINKEFRVMVKEARETPTGEHSTLLSSIFNLEGGSEGPGIKSGQTIYETKKNMQKTFEDDKTIYTHKITFKTKKKSEYKRYEGRQISHILFQADFKSMDEVGKSLPINDIIGFKAVSFKEYVYDSDLYQDPNEVNILNPSIAFKPLEIDNKYREYSVEWESDKIDNEVAGILIIRPNFNWKLGRED